MIFHFQKKQVKNHGPYAVHRKPWSVKKTAVAECTVFPEKNQYFPEISTDGGNKIEKEHKGNKVCNIFLLRCAELSKIRLCMISFHGNSIPRRKNPIRNECVLCRKANTFLINLTKSTVRDKKPCKLPQTIL